MKKFEYKIIGSTDFSIMGDQNKGGGESYKYKRDLDTIKKLSKKGWELVTIGEDGEYYFKREKK